MKRISFYSLFVLVSTMPLAAAAKVGDRAPDIHFDRLLPDQPLTNVRFEAFAGKVVVLDLWATWCAPCVKSIPHHNELVEQFKDQPVVFLSVSEEEPSVVEAFLKKRPIRGLVGIAHKNSPWGSYGVAGIPATFLIDAKGKIAAAIGPPLLRPSMIETLIAGRPLPVFEMTVIPCAGSSVSTQSSRSSMVMEGSNLTGMVSNFWQVNRSRILGGDETTCYDLFSTAPLLNFATFASRSRAMLEAALNFEVTRETRETDVLILGKTEAKPIGLKEAGTLKMTTSDAGVIQESNRTVSEIAGLLEDVFKKPVIDETGITGRYDFQLPNNGADLQASIATLRKLGFRIEPARRMIEVLVVTKGK